MDTNQIWGTAAAELLLLRPFVVVLAVHECPEWVIVFAVVATLWLPAAIVAVLMGIDTPPLLWCVLPLAVSVRLLVRLVHGIIVTIRSPLARMRAARALMILLGGVVFLYGPLIVSFALWPGGTAVAFSFAVSVLLVVCGLAFCRRLIKDYRWLHRAGEGSTAADELLIQGLDAVRLFPAMRRLFEMFRERSRYLDDRYIAVFSAELLAAAESIAAEGRGRSAATTTPPHFECPKLVQWHANGSARTALRRIRGGCLDELAEAGYEAQNRAAAAAARLSVDSRLQTPTS